MKINHVLLISLLIVGLFFVPAVSAEVLYDERIEYYEFTGGTGKGYPIKWVGLPYSSSYKNLIFSQIQNQQDLSYIVIDTNATTLHPEGVTTFTYTLGDKTNEARMHVKYLRNAFGGHLRTRYTLFFDGWDVSGLTGTYTIETPAFFYSDWSYENVRSGDSPVYLDGNPVAEYTITCVSGIYFKNNIRITDSNDSLVVTLNRVIDGLTSASTLNVYGESDNLIYTDTADVDVTEYFLYRDVAKIELVSVDRTFTYPISSAVSPTPTLPTTRTGTVTMTDHNGTTIRGFEVKAVNYYTGEEYTVSTDTDVATITLPMDLTTTRRHTQTGEYVEVPIGYYLFYGYKSGYKMTNEEGIRISVVPEEYQGSYQLCDIIVTSETGYLTGKHQFQLRSRSDNSILQTGTISAQSATTGEWYNTTVYNGMATLILPYDTSDMISKYVGNYFVYGSSPGYLDSEYAVRVSVRPDTQYEIWGIYLTPIGGVPEPGYVKLRIQAISEKGQNIPNAEVFIKGVDGHGWELWETYTTSSTGYAEISVPENSIYDITVSAKGYTSGSQRVEVTTEDPPLLHFMLYLSGWVTPEPTTQPTGWGTPPPTTKPPGIPDEDDKSEGFLMEAVRGISKVFGVGFATGKTIFGMLLALAIGFTTAKHLRGGAAEFGLGLLGGTMLGVLIGLLPVWTVVVLLLIVGMYIGYRYVGGGNNG